MASVLKVGSASVSGYPSQGSLASSTARPYTLAGLDVDSALTLQAIENNLRMEATLDDAFMDIGQDVVFTGKKMAMPEACVIRLKAEAGARSITVPMLKPATGEGRYGDSEAQLGYERGQAVKFMQAFYNEYSYALAGEEWGINYNDVNKFGLYKQIQPEISKWFREKTGKFYREALLQSFSTPLTKSPVSKTQIWNPNWFVPNTTYGNQPAYDSTVADFSTALGTAFAAADTGTAGANAGISLDYLLALDDYAQTQKRIEPLDLGGKKSYVVFLPSTQYNKLIQTTSGQLGAIWENVSALSQEEQNFPGIVGRVKSLVIVSDTRYPTIEFDQYSAGMTVTVEYVEPGNDDSRNTAVYNSSSNMAWDIGFLLGKGALYDWTVRDIHFEMDKTEYGKLYGKGAFCERGIGLAYFDVDTNADATREHYGSIVLPFVAGSLVSVA